MHALNRVSEQDNALLQTSGSVLETNDGELTVATDFGKFRARRALSCLIIPEAGDRVLLAGCGEEMFVLAVLERSATTPLQITLARDVNIAAPNGRITIAASEGIELVSAGNMGLTTATLQLRAGSARIFLNKMQYLGRRIFAEFETVKLIGSILDSVMERVCRKVKRSYRIVQELDHVRAEQIDYRARKNFSFRGKNTLVTAEELVKFDGDQIHMG